MTNPTRNLIRLSVAAAAAVTVFSGIAVAAATAPLTLEKTIQLPGSAGKFDFVVMDYTKRRLLAAHKGVGMLTVFGLKKETSRSEVKVGEVQGIAVSDANGQYYAGDAGEQKVVVIDSKTLLPVAEIPTAGPVDAIELDPKSGVLYATHDDVAEVWTIDTKTDKVTGFVAINGAPEVLVYDPATDAIYLNIKSTNSVQKIDPATNSVTATWSTLPAKGPHGLVLNTKMGRLYSAGTNGKLVVLDVKSGERISAVDIAPGVDQIAYDSGNGRIYCGCDSAISVVEETADGAKSLGNVKVTKGGKTLGVDPVTHAVWWANADAKGSYLSKYVVSK